MSSRDTQGHVHSSPQAEIFADTPTQAALVSGKTEEAREGGWHGWLPLGPTFNFAAGAAGTEVHRHTKVGPGNHQPCPSWALLPDIYHL